MRADVRSWWQTRGVTNEDHTREQLAKLADLERRAEELAERPHYYVHDGELVLDPGTGEPLRDDEPTLRGLDVQLGALKLRAQILGLDAPQRHHLVDEDGNALDITRLVAVLRKLGLAAEVD
jgi:hypothetical protein